MSCDEPDCCNAEFRIENGSSGTSRGYVDSDCPRATRNKKSAMSRLFRALRASRPRGGAKYRPTAIPLAPVFLTWHIPAAIYGGSCGNECFSWWPTRFYRTWGR